MLTQYEECNREKKSQVFGRAPVAPVFALLLDALEGNIIEARQFPLDARRGTRVRGIYGLNCSPTVPSGRRPETAEIFGAA